MLNKLTATQLKEALEAQFSEQLPGYSAQKAMSPEGREQMLKMMPKNAPFRDAAVLVGLYFDGEDWQFPLIHRSEDGYAHSGQVSLPGGKLERAETIHEAAIREAEEEIGLPGTSVTILDTLTSLPIPFSNFMVHPVVALVDGVPNWQIEEREVQSVFTVGLKEFLNDELINQENLSFNGVSRLVPYYSFSGHKVWGATAMILSEFRQILNTISRTL
ncbi:MAG TPA: hypothetical protein DCZ03_05870 [Gammaproteobacteria bacterium]|nr:hypothetical protein [Gammaproteobacteria bacterium]